MARKSENMAEGWGDGFAVPANADKEIGATGGIV